MTLNQMVLEVWQLIGEPTDIDPTDGTYPPDSTNIDDTSSGYSRILTMLNEGQIAVVSHRQVRGRQFKWSGGVLTTAVTNTPTTTTLDTAASAGDFSISTALSGSADDWNGWAIKVGQEVRRVVDSTADGDLTLGQALDNDHASGATVYLIDLPLTLPDNLWYIRRVWDYELQSHVDPAPRDYDMMQSFIEGDPVYYWRNNRELWFDAGWFSTNRTYGIEYQRFPLTMSSSQESELPDNFHWALVLYAAGWGYWRQQESAEKKNIRDEYNEFMRMRLMEVHVEDNDRDIGGAVRRDY